MTRELLLDESAQELLKPLLPRLRGAIRHQLELALPSVRHETAAARRSLIAWLVVAFALGTLAILGVVPFLLFIVRQPAVVVDDLLTWWAGYNTIEHWTLSAGMAAIVIIAPWAIFTIPRRLRSAWRFWRSELLETVTPIAREVVNEVLEREHDDTLFTGRAPALSADTDDRRLVIRNEVMLLNRLCRDLGAGALAISGPRGSGKTTLLRAATGQLRRGSSIADPDGLGMIVRAPVAYDPREFIIHLFSALCTKVLEIMPRSSRLVYGVSTVTRLLLLPILTALLISFLTFGVTIVVELVPENRPEDLVLPTNSVLVAALGAIATAASTVLLFKLAWYFGDKREHHKTFALTTEAKHHLRRLRYLESVTSIRNVGLRHGPLSLLRGRARQLSEQQSALPDLIDTYRDFLQKVTTTIAAGQPGPSVVIGIDELDRIASAEDAENFLNEIKAIFGLPRSVYVVTISEDALERFQGRILYERDVLDSTFDEVIQLQPFDAVESKELLSRRVVGMPDSFVGFCYCLSGGVPRDLVRAARAVIKAANGHPAKLPDVVEKVVSGDIDRLMHNLQRRLTKSQSSPAIMQYLADLSPSTGWPGGTSSDILREAAKLPGSSEDTWVREPLMAALVFYATLLDLFDKDMLAFDDPYVIYALADARSLMPISPSLALHQLGTLRGSLGLVVPTQVLRSSGT